MRRQQQADQRGRSVRRCCRSGHGGGERRGFVELGGERPDHVHSGHQHVLAKLLDRDLGFAARDELRHRAALAKLRFGFHWIRDAKSLQQLHEKAGLARSFRALSPEERQRIVQRVSDLAGNAVEYYKA